MEFTFEMKSLKGLELAIEKAKELKEQYPGATIHIKLIEERPAY